MTKRFLKILAAGSAIFLMTACGSTPSSPADPNALTEIKVGIVPVATAAPLYLGIQKGFFADEGLELNVESIGTSSSIVAAAVSGDIDVGFVATVNMLKAQLQGLPVKVVGGGSYTSESEPDANLLASKNSGITKVSELAGKKIAVNELQGQSELGIRAALDEAGVAQDSVKIIALSFPEMGAALDSGRIDAAGIVEPFASSAKKSGAISLISDYYQKISPDFTVTVWFSSDKRIENNKKETEAFSRAFIKSWKYAQDHPDERAAVIPQYTKSNLDQAKALPIQNQSPLVDIKTVERQAELMKLFNFTDKNFKADEFVATIVKDQVLSK